MKPTSVNSLIGLVLCGLMMGCSSTQERGGQRQPAGAYSRAGREYREPRPMNHRRSDPDAIYNACVRERSEMYCRNRMGR